MIQPAAKLAALCKRAALATAVAQAQATLDSARAKLAAMKAGGSTAAVAQAQANLDSARRPKLAAMKGRGQPPRSGSGAGQLWTRPRPSWPR